MHFLFAGLNMSAVCSHFILFFLLFYHIFLSLVFVLSFAFYPPTERFGGYSDELGVRPSICPSVGLSVGLSVNIFVSAL